MNSYDITHFPFSFSSNGGDAIGEDLLDIFCPVCGKQSEMEAYGANRRETGICKSCGSWNRQRLLALFLLRNISEKRGVHVESLSSDLFPESLSIYSAEWFGAIHKSLSRFASYRWSRYCGSGYDSGAIVEGVTHQDLTNTSYEDNTFDFVLTADVLEHIPNPYFAHQEIFRILRKGGKHIFTVPSNLNVPSDQSKALMINGEVVHLSPPQWHGREEDSNLVYNVFGLEMIYRLWAIGFEVKFHEFSKPEFGIVGPRSFIFEATKQ